MIFRMITQCLGVLFLGCVITSSSITQSLDQTMEKRIEVNQVNEIEYWWPIEVRVKTGEQTEVRTVGSQLFHDAILVNAKLGVLSIDLDLVVLCPDSEQKFVEERSFPARLHNGSSHHIKRNAKWKLQFGKDCVVESRDLGSPVIEVTTPALSSVKVTKFGRLRIEEMIDDQILIKVGGTATAEIDRVRGEIVHAFLSGSSSLNVESMESVVNTISLSGTAELEFGSLASSRVNLYQSGSSELESKSIETDQLVLKVDGTSDTTVRRVFASAEPSDFEDLTSSTIGLSGSTDISIENLQLPELEIHVSGTSDLSLGKVNSDRLTISTSGSSDVSVEQVSTDQSKIESRGTSDVKITKFESSQAEIHSSGTSDVKVRSASVDQLDVQSKGTSSVTVQGQTW